MMALDALCDEVPPKMVLTIAKKETTKDAWDVIVAMRVGDDRVKRVTVQQLRQNFDPTTFNDGETIEDYALRLRGMAAHLTTLCEEVKDSEIIMKKLRSLPSHFKQIMIMIKILLDMSTMSVADLIVMLNEVKEAFEEAPTSLPQDGKLYLTEEERDVRRKKREGENHSGGGAGKGGRRDRYRGRDDSSSGEPSNKPTDNERWHYDKMGHWHVSVVRSPRKSRRTSHKTRRRGRSS
jgi:hypothetical protein